jgi:hypothetical protein
MGQSVRYLPLGANLIFDLQSVLNVAMSRSSQSSQQNGHSSRRDNHSISSNASGSGRSERASQHHSVRISLFLTFHRADLKGFKPAVESAVTRLLVSIKQLLEALTLWSQVRMDEEGVSNVYVQLGNDFNEAVAAFSAFNIDMTYVLKLSDIFSVHPGFTRHIESYSQYQMISEMF